MVNKESQRRKIEGSKKESRRQTKKDKKRKQRISKERQRRKIESRRQRNQNIGKERLKRIGSEETKMKKCVSFREQIATKERKKKTTEVRSAR